MKKLHYLEKILKINKFNLIQLKGFANLLYLYPLYTNPIIDNPTIGPAGIIFFVFISLLVRAPPETAETNAPNACPFSY